MFENRVLRKMFGPNSDEVTEEWRRLHNEELLDLYFLPEIISLIVKQDEMGRGYSTHGTEDNCVQDFVWKT